MPHFRYQALNAQEQIIASELEAPSVSQAIAQLEADGLTVQSIGYATPDARSTEIPPRDVSPVAPGVEQAALERHLERVIERGRVLAPALYAYAAEMPSGRSRRQLGAVLRILDSGNAAAAATDLQKLPTYWIPLLSAAASSQDPGRILQEFLKESQRAEEFRRQWRQMLAYPLFVLGGAIAVMIFLSIVAIPSFRDIFSGFGLRLPGLTQFVLTLAAWIASGQILIPIVLLAAIAMLLVWATRLLPLAVRERLGDRFGTPLGRSTAIAQFSQFLADLLEAELE
ncbi:MAG TPA: type II secretion system F family protein, partial [Pirellulaceae bacterium]|nr:type II secretion system F family protein [Pirellulaceae bacterium]